MTAHAPYNIGNQPIAERAACGQQLRPRVNCKPFCSFGGKIPQDVETKVRQVFDTAAREVFDNKAASDASEGQQKVLLEWNVDEDRFHVPTPTSQVGIKTNVVFCINCLQKALHMTETNSRYLSLSNDIKRTLQKGQAKAQASMKFFLDNLQDRAYHHNGMCYIEQTREESFDAYISFLPKGHTHPRPDTFRYYWKYNYPNLIARDPRLDNYGIGFKASRPKLSSPKNVSKDDDPACLNAPQLDEIHTRTVTPTTEENDKMVHRMEDKSVEDTLLLEEYKEFLRDLKAKGIIPSKFHSILNQAGQQQGKGQHKRQSGGKGDSGGQTAGFVGAPNVATRTTATTTHSPSKGGPDKQSTLQQLQQQPPPIQIPLPDNVLFSKVAGTPLAPGNHLIDNRIAGNPLFTRIPLTGNLVAGNPLFTGTPPTVNTITGNPVFAANSLFNQIPFTGNLLVAGYPLFAGYPFVAGNGMVAGNRFVTANHFTGNLTSATGNDICKLKNELEEVEQQIAELRETTQSETTRNPNVGLETDQTSPQAKLAETTALHRNDETALSTNEHTEYLPKNAPSPSTNDNAEKLSENTLSPKIAGNPLVAGNLHNAKGDHRQGTTTSPSTNVTENAFTPTDEASIASLTAGATGKSAPALVHESVEHPTEQQQQQQQQQQETPQETPQSESARQSESDGGRQRSQNQAKNHETTGFDNTTTLLPLNDEAPSTSLPQNFETSPSLSPHLPEMALSPNALSPNDAGANLSPSANLPDIASPNEEASPSTDKTSPSTSMINLPEKVLSPTDEAIIARLMTDRKILLEILNDNGSSETLQGLRQELGKNTSNSVCQIHETTGFEDAPTVATEDAERAAAAAAPSTLAAEDMAASTQQDFDFEIPGHTKTPLQQLAIVAAGVMASSGNSMTLAATSGAATSNKMTDNSVGRLEQNNKIVQPGQNNKIVQPGEPAIDPMQVSESVVNTKKGATRKVEQDNSVTTSNDHQNDEASSAQGGEQEGEPMQVSEVGKKREKCCLKTEFEQLWQQNMEIQAKLLQLQTKLLEEQHFNNPECLGDHQTIVQQTTTIAAGMDSNSIPGTGPASLHGQTENSVTTGEENNNDLMQDTQTGAPASSPSKKTQRSKRELSSLQQPTNVGIMAHGVIVDHPCLFGRRQLRSNSCLDEVKYVEWNEAASLDKTTQLPIVFHGNWKAFEEDMWKIVEKITEEEDYNVTDLFDSQGLDVVQKGVYFKGHLKNEYLLKYLGAGQLPPGYKLKNVEQKGIVFINKETSQCVTHYDRDTSILLLLSGKKEIFLAKRNDTVLAEFEDESNSTLFPKIDPFASGSEKGSDEGLNWHKVTLTPPEALLVPQNWVHCVKSYKDTIAVSVQVQVADDGEKESPAQKKGRRSK